jgi:hypothetical protein
MRRRRPEKVGEISVVILEEKNLSVETTGSNGPCFQVLTPEARRTYPEPEHAILDNRFANEDDEAATELKRHGGRTGKPGM